MNLEAYAVVWQKRRETKEIKTRKNNIDRENVCLHRNSSPFAGEP
jgi:hypothetical protein